MARISSCSAPQMQRWRLKSSLLLEHHGISIQPNNNVTAHAIPVNLTRNLGASDRKNPVPQRKIFAHASFSRDVLAKKKTIAFPDEVVVRRTGEQVLKTDRGGVGNKFNMLVTAYHSSNNSSSHSNEREENRGKLPSVTICPRLHAAL